MTSAAIITVSGALVLDMTSSFSAAAKLISQGCRGG
jgi:hypothetical protein